MDTTRRRTFWRGPVWWMLLACVIAGCCSATDETKAMSAAVVEHFDLIRAEGKTWDDATWDKRLRQMKSEAATVDEFVQTGTLEKGAALRHRDAAFAKESP
jgi:hypothetical protein